MANIIRVGGGAGGGGLDIKIVGGTTQPASPKDNTIWVNTGVAIGTATLAPNAPTSPVVGDVWVNTSNKYNSNGTNASTNLIRVNDNPYLEINVLNISQWDGSAWVTRENSAIYANGGWTNMALYIYNYGTRNEAYPLKAGASHYNNAYLDSYPIGITYSTDYFSFSPGFHDDSTKKGICMCTETVDLSKFNKMRITMRSQHANGNIYAGYVTTLNPLLNNGIAALASLKSTAITTVEADISSYTNTVYPALQSSAHSSSVSGTYAGIMTVYFWCFTA